LEADTIIEQVAVFAGARCDRYHRRGSVQSGFL